MKSNDENHCVEYRYAYDEIETHQKACVYEEREKKIKMRDDQIQIKINYYPNRMRNIVFIFQPRLLIYSRVNLISMFHYTVRVFVNFVGEKMKQNEKKSQLFDPTIEMMTAKDKGD